MQAENLDEPGKPRVILRITVNLDSPFGQLQRAVMRMVDLVSFGLSAGQQSELTEPPRLPDVFLQKTFWAEASVRELMVDATGAVGNYQGLRRLRAFKKTGPTGREIPAQG